jgi:hypothetical protein
MQHRIDPVQRLLAEAAIRAQLARYASAVDRLDFEEVRACYAQEATDDHGTYSGPVDGLIAHLRGILSRHITTTHFLGNCQFDFARENSVSTETYCMLHCRYRAHRSGELMDLTCGLRYVDRWRPGSDGQWVVAKRVVAFDWTRIDPVGRVWDESAGFTRRRRDKSDPWLTELSAGDR